MTAPDHHNIDPLAIAHFGRIELDERQLEGIRNKFSSILDAFDVVADVQVHAQVEVQEPKGRMDLRKDLLKESLGQERALANAPACHEGHFRVPPVL